jgi:hypothetical protein
MASNKRNAEDVDLMSNEDAEAGVQMGEEDEVEAEEVGNKKGHPVGSVSTDELRRRYNISVPMNKQNEATMSTRGRAYKNKPRTLPTQVNLTKKQSAKNSKGKKQEPKKRNWASKKPKQGKGKFRRKQRTQTWANFTKEEDVLVCPASMSASQNSIIGANQKDIKFWKNRVETQYSALTEVEVEPDEQGMKSWEVRSHEALKRRLLTVSRDVRKVHAILPTSIFCSSHWLERGRLYRTCGD